MLMKGQVTVEYLLLFSIGLVLIAFAIGALAVIKDTEGQLTSIEQAKIAVATFKSAGDSACALGSGNSRVVDLAWSVELDCQGDVIKATVGGQSAVSGLEHCEVTCSGEGSSFRVINENGEIGIEEN